MALRNSAANLTTDIMNEPITCGGLCSRVEILPGADRHVIMEALGLRKNIEQLAALAERLRVEALPLTNVIDFKTRKPYANSGDVLSFEIVEDAAPGRYDTGYVIFEASGPRALIQRLASEATSILV